MKNAHSDGNTINITGPATSGVPLIVGDVLAIPLKTLASGEAGAAVIDGQAVTLPKLSSAVIGQGKKVIWDVSAGEVIIASAAAGDLNNFGIAVEAAGNGVPAVAVRLTPGAGSLQGA